MQISGRYSQYARRAMLQARLCARDLQHSEVDTGHLVVGILRTEGCLGQRILTGLGLSLATTENAVALLHLRGMPGATAAIPMSDALRAALTFAVAEARALGQRTVGTEHLLLGLTRCESGAAGDILEAGEVSADQLRGEVMRLVRAGRSETAQEFAGLSDAARGALDRAAALAAEANQSRPMLPHLLLALARETGPAGELLRACGLNEDDLMQDAAALGQGSRPDALYDVLNDAALAAERLGSATTDLPHLLFALARGRHGTRLLPRYGVDLALLRRRIAALLRAR